MLPIITPAEAAKRPADDQSFIVNFYWRADPVLERILSGIKDQSCGLLRSLRFTWARPRSRASSEDIFLGETLPGVLDGAERMADAPLEALHLEKVAERNNLFALSRFANGVVAEFELNECLPRLMPDICFIKANFTGGHMTNQPLVGHFNEEGALLADDASCRLLRCEHGDLPPAESPIEQMRRRFRLRVERNAVPAGDQGAAALIAQVNLALRRMK